MSTDAYLDAKAEFERADAAISEIAKAISDVAGALTRSRETFSFSNTGQGLPMEAMMSRNSVSADGYQWPSAGKIMEKLAAWHSAKSKMMNAWHAIPNERKAGLVAPKDARNPSIAYR